MKIKDTFKERRSRFKPLAEEQGRFTCPCCGFPSIRERSAYEICPICFWEDDGQDDPKAAEVLGGPNKDYSLSEARDNFQQFGTMYDKRHRDRFDEETSAQREGKKRRLIKAYESVFAASSSKELETAWNQVKKIE